jgi:transposase
LKRQAHGGGLSSSPQKAGHEIVMSHSKQTKAIASARLKSDKVDVLMLAKLLKGDLLPTVWIPPPKQRYVRELLTHRSRLVRQRTAVINELHALYAKRNIDPGMVFHRVRPPAFRLEERSAVFMGRGSLRRMWIF